MTQLTPRERDCLRLVGQARSSKEIAIELGLSPFTVDEYVRSAVAKLGARNRREAARLIKAETDAASSPEKLGDEPACLAEPDLSPAAMEPAGRKGGPKWRLPFLRQGRRYNDLGWRDRLLWIVVGAVAIIVLFSQLANGMQVIESMFRGR
jgi:DNA-binding CsgD family transcriptional regulator